MITVKQLKEKLNDFPEDMLLAINDDVSESQGLLQEIKVYNSENAPYDKGDNIWKNYSKLEGKDVLFLRYTGIITKELR